MFCIWLSCLLNIWRLHCFLQRVQQYLPRSNYRAAKFCLNFKLEQKRWPSLIDNCVELMICALYFVIFVLLTILANVSMEFALKYYWIVHKAIIQQIWDCRQIHWWWSGLGCREASPQSPHCQRSEGKQELNFGWCWFLEYGFLYCKIPFWW